VAFGCGWLVSREIDGKFEFLSDWQKTVTAAAFAVAMIHTIFS
jgi:hypothetical protein